MNSNELTIGLDLGDRRHHGCVLSTSGEILAEEVIPNTRECAKRKKAGGAKRGGVEPREERARVLRTEDRLSRPRRG